MRLKLLILLLTASIFGFSQEEKKPQKVKIEHADELEGGIVDGKEVRKLRGDVIFSQDSAKMYCDSAYQYSSTNSIDAFGRVKIVQQEMTITGDFLTYDGNSRIAKMRGNVVMKDKTMTLYTDNLDYNLGTKTAYYYAGGKIIDKGTVLTSTRGSYHSPSKMLFFKDSVHLDSKDYQVWCDTLNYSTNSKTAYFLGPTDIESKGTKLFAKKGTYNTITKESHFENQTTINDSTYTLTGDSVHYNEKTRIGFAQGNVELFLKKDSIVINGETGISNENTGISRVFGKGTLMRNLMKSDTVYLKADTLMAVNDTSDNLEKLLAWNNVKLFKSDLQAKCDSLAYNFADSTISLHTIPILWSEDYQITGDFIKIQLANDEVDKMFVNENSFVISEDEYLNYNQIKGKDMIAKFKDGKMDILDVKEKGQSLYYVIEDSSVFSGLNKTICKDMIFRFDSGELKRITFLVQPEAKFIPPQEISNPDKFLPGYEWRIKEQPKLEEMLIF